MPLFRWTVDIFLQREDSMNKETPKILLKMEELLLTYPLPSGAKTMVFLYAQKNTAARCTWIFENYEVDFVLYRKGPTPGLSNSLECRLRQRGEEALSLPLSYVLLKIHPQTYNCTRYPFIAIEQQLKAAVAELWSVFTKNLALLHSYLSDDQNRQTLFGEIAKKINDYAGDSILIRQDGLFVPDGDFDIQDVQKTLSFFYMCWMTDFFIPPLVHFFGVPPQRPRKPILPDNPEAELLKALPEEVVCYSPLQKELYLNSRKANHISSLPKFFGAVFLNTLMVGLPALLICLLLYFFCAGKFNSDVLYSTSLGEQIFCLALPLFFSGYIALLFDRRTLYRFIYGRRNALGYAEMESTAKRRAYGIFASILTSLLLVFTILMGKYTVRFENSRLVDSSNLFSLKEKIYSYEDIQEAAWVTQRIAPNGNVLQSPHFILRMNDGSQIDLYPLTSSEECRKKIRPILEEKNVFIQEYEKESDFQRHGDS